MVQWRKRIRKLTYLMMDVACILMTFLLTEFAFMRIQGGSLALTAFERIAYVMLFIMSLIGLNLIFHVYDQTIENYGRVNLKIAFKMILSLFGTEVFMGAVLFYLKVSLSRSLILEFMIALVAVTVIQRWVFKMFIGPSRSEKKLRNILIVGHSPKGKKYLEEMQNYKYLDYHIIGYISIKEQNNYENLKHIGTIEELRRVAVDYVVDEIAVAKPLDYDVRMKEQLDACQKMGMTISMIVEPVYEEYSLKAEMVGDVAVMKYHMVSHNETHIFAKRVLDIMGAMAGMVLFGIAYIIVGLLIKMETPGPVIFKQNRVGKNGRIFEVWKFRSMGVNAEAEKAALMANNEMSGHMFKMSNDPRVTRIGAFIRKTSIDELPQFIMC